MYFLQCVFKTRGNLRVLFWELLLTWTTEICFIRIFLVFVGILFYSWSSTKAKWDVEAWALQQEHKEHQLILLTLRYHFAVELRHLWHVLNYNFFLWVQSLPVHLLMRDTELCAWLEVLLCLWNSWFIEKGVPLKRGVETRKCSTVSSTESSVLCGQSSWRQQPAFGGPEALAIKKEEKEVGAERVRFLSYKKVRSRWCFW